MPQEFAERYGPWALVTGAARGIGRAFAWQLVERGLSVVAVDMLEAELGATCDLLRTSGAGVEPMLADLANDESVERLARLAAEREIGLFVHCAAQIPSGRFLDADTAQHARAVAVNARTPLLLAHAFGSQMRRRGRGGIILVSSMAALYGTGWVATYAATKAFEIFWPRASGGR